MHAILHERYGAIDDLRLADVPSPTPGAGEVLVRVRAAGPHRGEAHLVTGRPGIVRFMGYGLLRPKRALLGTDLAGVVEAVGPGVTTLAPGDEVVGWGRGTYAELAVASAAMLVPKPARLGWAEAAVLPTSGTTAVQAIGLADLRPGQRVLVLGAASGVGTFAVQLACSAGAEVTGVASGPKLGLVRSLGAVRTVDRTTTDPLDGGARYDAILDIAGRRPVAELTRGLAPDGRLVMVGGENGGTITGGYERTFAGALRAKLGERRIRVLVATDAPADLAALLALVDAGRVTPVVERTYPLARAAEALRHLDEGRAAGKVAITL